MRLVIKGSEWLRGDEGVLRDHDGRYCCLGIHAKACGIPDTIMVGVGTPEDLGSHVTEPYAEAWLMEHYHDAHRLVDKDIVNTAIGINDDPDIDDDERIRQLRPLFKEVGVTLVWRPDL